MSKTVVILGELQVLWRTQVLAKNMQNGCIIKTETHALKEKKDTFFEIKQQIELSRLAENIV